MAHTNSTSNYELSQFIGTDKPTFLGDYNGDMQKIDAAIKGAKDTADGASTTANAASALATSASETATTAASAAASADANATTALNTANGATTTANSALSTANSAASTATSAAETATAADTKATAAGTAQGTSYSAPAGSLAVNVKEALDELYSGTGGGEHGLFELWNNPTPASAYATATITIANFDATKYDSIELEWAVNKDETRGNVVERFEVAAFTSATLNAKEQHILISSNVLVLYARDVTISMDNGALKIVVGSGNQYAYNTYGSAPQTTATDDVLIPVRVLGLVHNS